MDTRHRFVLSLLLALGAGGVMEGELAGQDTDSPESAVQDGEAHFQAGRDALFRGQYELAMTELRAAVAADTEGAHTSWRVHLARALQYAGHGEDAQVLLREVLRGTPDHVEAGQMLAELYRDEGKWTEVLKVLEPLLEYRHDYSTLHLLGEAAYMLDEPGKSRDFFREAIRLNPGTASDHYMLANLELAQNRFAQAARSYEKALALGDDSAILHYKLASCYFNLRNYFGKVQEAVVASGEPGTLHGDLYLIERAPGATDTFHAAPKRSAIYQTARALADGLEGDPDLRMLLANVYRSARRYRQAYDLYVELEKDVREEDRALYHFFRAEAAFGLGDFDEYLRAIGTAAELDPAAYGTTKVDAHLEVAEKANQNGDRVRFLAELEAAVAVSPQTASLHLKLGDAYAESRQYEKAVRQWRMVLDLEPDHPMRTELVNRIQRGERSP